MESSLVSSRLVVSSTLDSISLVYPSLVKSRQTPPSPAQPRSSSVQSSPASPASPTQSNRRGVFGLM
eukprot:8103561-Lingulodinium_polyedra.AAC.1